MNKGLVSPAVLCQACDLGIIEYGKSLQLQEKLVSARMLARSWRYAIVIIAVAAAVITPTADPINMMLLMAPLIGIYFLSILMAIIARR